MSNTHRLRRGIAPWLAVAALASTFSVAALTVVESPQQAAALNETITATFYVPLYEDNARAALFGTNSGTGTNLSSTTSITVAAPNTVVYYDHWESGNAGVTTPTYDATPNNPGVGSSTLVFGDGNTANGDAATYCVPVGCAGDIMPVGAVLRLNNSSPSDIVPGVIATPRTSDVVKFDGRDRISSTDPISVTHATWPTAINALHSEMAAAFDTSRWGVNFVAPVGTNTANEGSGVSNYSYAGIEVMAKEAGTEVYVDANKDGDYNDVGVDVNGTTIGEGEYVYVAGVVQGATAMTTKPTQVFMMTGRVGSNYEDRSYQVFPTEGLVNDYTVPASTARDDGTNKFATVLYIHNPKSFAITVNVQTSSGTTPYTVNAGTTLTPAPWLTANQTARVYSTETFAIFAGSGTRMQATNVDGSGDISQDYDWGFSPVPARLLLDSVYVGWAPGSQDLTAADNDVVWVTTNAATTVYVDYDADPATGTFVDPAGALYDVAYPVTALTQLKITDTTDNDMTGAHIYTVDSVGLATAYGEDPKAGNEKGTPGIDLGTTMFPACGAMCTHKTVELAVDQDGDGHVDPGDTLQWTTEAINTDYYNLVNPWLFDTLPTGLTYVPGTATIVVNSGLATPIPDDSVPPAASLFPFDESGRQIAANIPVDGSLTIRYQTVVDTNYSGSGRICNRALITSTREGIGSAANGASTSCIPIDGLRLTKTSNSGGDPVEVGDTLVYTLTVSNTTTSTLSNIIVTDPYPQGLSWVSTDVTRPAISTTTNTYADNFETANWSGSTGTTAWSATSWTDSEDTSTTTGFLRKVTDAGDQSVHFRPSAPLNLALTRQVGSLTTATAVTLAFDYRCNLDSGDEVKAQVRPTSGGTWVDLATYNTCNSGTSYLAASLPLTSGQWGASTQIRFIVTNAFSTGGGDDFWIDNVVVSATVPGGRVVSTVPGAVFPDLVTLTDLLAGESATIVVTTTVTGTPPAEIANFAMARSGNQVAAAEVVDCVSCFDFGDDPISYEGVGTDPGRAAQHSLRNTYGDTFQTGAFAGSTGSADWAASSWSEVDAGGLGATAGTLRNVADGSERSVRFNQSALNTALSRVIGDLSGYSAAYVNVAYRCSSLEAGDVVTLQVRANGSDTWTDLDTYSNCNGVTYSNEIYNIPTADLGSATELRFIVTNAFDGANDIFYVNDAQVTVANHSTITGPRLGTNADREVAGVGGAAPNPAAPGAIPSGDDSASSPDDEDGVVLPSVDTNVVQIPITVVDGDGGASYVNGWIDWNNNHVFDSGESIFDPARFASATGGMTVVNGTGLAPAPGTYTVSVNVPALDSNGSGFTVGSKVYTRFRVATLSDEVASPTGASSDGEVEDFWTTLNTLPVNLAYLGSSRNGDSVTVDWRTAQEVDNAGFNLYATAPDGSLVQLNDELVPTNAPTSVVPQSYQLTVATSAEEIWLEDIALDGVPTLHGPFAVGTNNGDPTPPAAIDWASLKAANDATLRAARPSAQRNGVQASPVPRSPRSFVGPVAQLAVTESGIQRITYEQLAAAGIDLNGVPVNTLAVTDRSGPVAIEVLGGPLFGAGSAVQFVGDPIDTLYTGTNVYWLHLDIKKARRVTTDATVASAEASPVTSHTATVVVDKNLVYSVTAPGDDPWYEKRLFANGATPSSATTTVTITDPVAGQPAAVEVELWGSTRTAVANEHHVKLEVNGTFISDFAFDDADVGVLKGTVPAGVLVAGANTLKVTLLTDTGVRTNIVLVNTWTVRYQRSNVANTGRLDIAAAGARVDATGLGDAPVAYRVAADGATTKLAPTVIDGVVQVPGTATASRYVFSTPESLRTPAISKMRADAGLLSGSADYLMITNQVLTGALTPLVSYHQGLGRSVKVVDVADIYQAYSHGIVDAAAIDEYVAAAVPALGADWVLLAGSDTFDYRNYTGLNSFSMVPSLYGPLGGSITFAPLDPAYADIDDDGVPDVALGRFPARTAAELTTMVDKTLAYAGSPARSAVFASDKNDGIDYAAVNDALAAEMTDWAIRRADVDRHTVSGARAEVLDALTDGVGLALYLGHSSAQEWTVGLFNTTDAATLHGPPTAVAQFGCWNSYYVSPYVDTLAHALMLNTQGGAAIVMGSVVLTSAATDIDLATALIAQVKSGQLTIGEAVLAAKQAVSQNAWGPVLDSELGWTVLGDPAIVVGGAA